MVLLRVIVQLILMLIVPLRADMLSSFKLTSETVVPAQCVEYSVCDVLSVYSTYLVQ